MVLGRAQRTAVGRRARACAVLLVLALGASACGSRLPDEVLEDIDSARTSSGRSDSNRSGDGGNGGDGGSDGVAFGFEDGATDGGGTTGDTGSTGADGSGTTATGGPGGPAGDPNCRGGATDQGVTANEIKVGSIVTASGPLPGATEGSYRGAQAYLAKVNAAGGVCGRRITLLKGDDGLDPQRARGEFLRLEPQVFAMVGGFSVADSGYGDLVKSAAIPYLGTMVDPAGRTATVYPKTPVGAVNTAPYEYFRDEYPQVQRIAFLWADVGGVRANTPTGREGLKRVGFQLVHDSGLSPVSPDFTSDVIAMRDRGAQGVYLFAFEVNMHVRLARNMRQQNFEPALKISQIGYNSRLLELLGGIANGWTNHIDYVPMLNEDEPSRNPALADFLAWHERVAPGASIDLFPVNGWAAAALFVEALRTLGPDVTRERLLAALESVTRYDGGGILAPRDPTSSEPGPCIAIVRVEDGVWVREHPATGFDCDRGEVYRYG